MSSNNQLALNNIQGDVFYLTSDFIDTGIEASRQSSRKRIICPIQRSQNDAVQRFFNFLQPGTYIRPHYHALKGATETIHILQGSIVFFVFEDDGTLKDGYYMEAGLTGSLIDIVPGVWHSFVVLSKDTVIVEFKRGPYNALTDKVYADWAPEEGSLAAIEYLKMLENAISE